MGKCMGRTCIIMCHGAHVITNIQTHLICCLTCLFHGVVKHGCVALTRCRHGCVMPTRCGHKGVALTRCGTLTRLIASLPLTSTCLPTMPYNRFTCVTFNACIVQGQPTELFNRLHGINTVGVDLKPWFALRHNPQL